MDAASFELHVTLPADPRFAATVREVVAHGARHCGCSDPRALAFGGTIEDALRESLAGARPAGSLSIVMSRRGGPMEVLITSEQGTRTLMLEI